MKLRFPTLFLLIALVFASGINCASKNIEANLNITPKSIDFGDSPMNATTYQDVSFHNTGYFDVKLVSATIVRETHLGVYSILSGAATLPYTLKAQVGIHTIRVGISSTAPTGVKTAELLIKYEPKPNKVKSIVIPIRCNTIDSPLLDCSSDTIDFGWVDKSVNDNEAYIEITNNGSQILEIRNISTEPPTGDTGFNFWRFTDTSNGNVVATRPDGSAPSYYSIGVGITRRLWYHYDSPNVPSGQVFTATIAISSNSMADNPHTDTVNLRAQIMTDEWTAIPDMDVGTSLPTIVSTTIDYGKRDAAAHGWTGTYFLISSGTLHYQSSSTVYFSDPQSVRYNPATNTWSDMTLTNAPARRMYTAYAYSTSAARFFVWSGVDTGSMVVNTGGVYNPTADSWTATSTTNAPSARYYCNAVDIGNSRVFVWSGSDTAGNLFTTGGIYDISTDTWVSTPNLSAGTNAPAGRVYPSLVYTGSSTRKVFVFGGQDSGGVLNTGGLYDIATDTWTAVSSSGVPAGRSKASITCDKSTGTVFITGGWDSSWNTLSTGGVFYVAANAWDTTSKYQNFVNGVGITAKNGAMMYFVDDTEDYFIMWGGRTHCSGTQVSSNTGQVYVPSRDVWYDIATPSIAGRMDFMGCWTGTNLIITGGISYTVAMAGYDSFKDGAKYTPK